MHQIPTKIVPFNLSTLSRQLRNRAWARLMGAVECLLPSELKTTSAAITKYVCGHLSQDINSASAPSRIVCSILVSTLFCRIDHVFPSLHSPFPAASLPHRLLGHTHRPLHPPISTYHISELVRLHYPLFCPTHCPHRWWRQLANLHS